MLKKMSLRKIAVTTFALLIMALFYLFPTNEYKLNPKKTITYEEDLNLKSIYLVDKYNYVSRIKLNIDEEEIYNIIKEKIKYLTIGSVKEDEIPNGFRSVIPEGTEILNLELKDNILTINFSKELLNIKEENEEKMIEAIIFSLTDIQQVKKIILKVDGNELTELPNSKKILNNPIDRKFGINKKYDFESLLGLTQTTVFYVNKINDEIYYTPITIVSNDDREKITVIIDELKSSLVYQSNLSSYLSSSTELKNFEIIEKTMYLTFNDKIFDTLGSKVILEEVKYTINLSIKENYDLEEVVFLVNDEEITVSTIKTLE